VRLLGQVYGFERALKVGRNEMRLRPFVVVALALTLLIATGSPGIANSLPTTGTRIRLLAPPATFAANTPFFIEGGVACHVPDEVPICTNASTHYDLFVDGAKQSSQVDIDLRAFEGDHFIFSEDLTNFPTGLPAGLHTFVALNYANGNLFDTTSVTITFT
jgi:hypothetical protein